MSKSFYFYSKYSIIILDTQISKDVKMEDYHEQLCCFFKKCT